MIQAPSESLSVYLRDSEQPGSAKQNTIVPIATDMNVTGGFHDPMLYGALFAELKDSQNQLKTSPSAEVPQKSTLIACLSRKA